MDLVVIQEVSRSSGAFYKTDHACKSGELITANVLDKKVLEKSLVMKTADTP